MIVRGRELVIGSLSPTCTYLGNQHMKFDWNRSRKNLAVLNRHDLNYTSQYKWNEEFSGPGWFSRSKMIGQVFLNSLFLITFIIFLGFWENFEWKKKRKVVSHLRPSSCLNEPKFQLIDPQGSNISMILLISQVTQVFRVRAYHWAQFRPQIDLFDTTNRQVKS